MRHFPLLILFVFATTFPAVANRGSLELEDVKPKFLGEVLSESLGEVLKEKIGADKVVIEKAEAQSFLSTHHGVIKYYSLNLNIFFKSKPDAFENCHLYPYPHRLFSEERAKNAIFLFAGCVKKLSTDSPRINIFYIYPDELKPGGRGSSFQAKAEE